MTYSLMILSHYSIFIIALQYPNFKGNNYEHCCSKFKMFGFPN